MEQLVFGLTGNIGCGKSTVAKILSTYSDTTYIDCDSIAKTILCTNAKDAAIRLLGPDILTNDGTAINFPAVAHIIFSDPPMRYALENLIHPMVHDRVMQIIHETMRKLCIVEHATLYETGWDTLCDAVIVATCKPHEQLRRLQNNRGMSMASIQARLTCQMDQQEKTRRAWYVIKTDCAIDELHLNVHKLHKTMKRFKRRTL